MTGTPFYWKQKKTQAHHAKQKTNVGFHSSTILTFKRQRKSPKNTLFTLPNGLPYDRFYADWRSVPEAFQSYPANGYDYQSPMSKTLVPSYQMPCCWEQGSWRYVSVSPWADGACIRENSRLRFAEWRTWWLTCSTQSFFFFLMLHIKSSYSSNPHLINTDGILPSSQTQVL